MDNRRLKYSKHLYSTGAIDRKVLDNGDGGYMYNTKEAWKQIFDGDCVCILPAPVADCAVEYEYVQ